MAVCRKRSTTRVPAALSISYLIGSPPIGTSMMTFTSRGGLLPIAMASMRMKTCFALVPIYRVSRIRETDPRSPVRASAGDAAGVVHAPSRALSAGVSCVARARGELSRFVLHARACYRGHAPADPPLRLRCGDPVLRHSRGAARTRAHGDVRGGRRAAAAAARRWRE